jgi:hypothetical protein
MPSLSSRPRLAAHHQSEEAAVTPLVLAPVVEVREDRMQPKLGMRLEMVRDVLIAVVADDLREVGRHEDPLRMHVLHLLKLRQIGQIEGAPHLAHHPVEERGVPPFVARHALVDRA